MRKSIYDAIKEKFAQIVRENNLAAARITISVTPLPAEKAIGRPAENDYPIIRGKERMMQAEFKGAYGHAFSDTCGEFSGYLSDVIAMELVDNYNRAVFISSLNAVLKYLGIINRTMHCRDSEPRECSNELVKYIEKNYGRVKIALVGFQPRMVEALSRQFELKVTDLDRDNIGTEKFGITIGGPENTEKHLDWCDIALVTGTTVVNGTIEQFLISKPVIFYGVTISGVASLLGLKHFCAYGH